MTQTVSSKSIVGIAASKVTGALPAVSGAALTNVSAGVYNNASDPAATSNRDLGTLWANSTTGELFVCTDATSNANIWINVGSGGGGIARLPFGGNGGGTVTVTNSNTIVNYKISNDLKEYYNKKYKKFRLINDLQSKINNLTIY